MQPIMNKKSKKYQLSDRNLQYFRTLGLPRGECRIDVIRNAAIKVAKTTVSRSHPATTDLHRAKVAVAAYKLLDPRNRNALYERVQLSCPLDEDEIHHRVRVSTSNLNRNMVVEKSQSAKGSIVRMMERDVVDRAIDPSSDEPSDDDAPESIEDSPSTELSLTEKRQVVRLLQESETSEGNLRSLSPLSWLRSYLKI
jgi:hypothetical protein